MSSASPLFQISDYVPIQCSAKYAKNNKRKIDWIVVTASERSLQSIGDLNQFTNAHNLAVST